MNGKRVEAVCGRKEVIRNGFRLERLWAVACLAAPVLVGIACRSRSTAPDPVTAQAADANTRRTERPEAMPFREDVAADARLPESPPPGGAGEEQPSAGAEGVKTYCETRASFSASGVLDCIGSGSQFNDERRLGAVRHIAEIAARAGDGQERDGLREAIFVTGPAVRRAVRDALVSLGEIDAAFASALPEPGEFVRAANALLEAAESPMTEVVADSC